MVDGAIIIEEPVYVFRDNLILYKLYPSHEHTCVTHLPEGFGIYNGPVEELLDQGFTFDEYYHE
jgi:hypothetical protein